jgi:AcrR family transcriptional regulator
VTEPKQRRRPARDRSTRDRRLAKADYLKVGTQLLAEGGLAAVTIANVCARLHVTKGSFYHHFESAPTFHAQLLAHYEEEYARRRIEAVDTIADTAARLDALVQRGVERDHEAESAIRAWSRTDPQAAEVVQRVDAARAQYLATFLAAHGIPEEQARVHADIAIAIVAGAQAMSRITDRRKLQAMLDEHRRWIIDAIEQTRIAKAGVGRGRVVRQAAGRS